MDPKLIGIAIDVVIFVGGGTYCTLLGYRIIGKKPGIDLNYDMRMNKHSGTLRTLGPILIVFGIVTATFQWLR